MTGTGRGGSAAGGNAAGGRAAAGRAAGGRAAGGSEGSSRPGDGPRGPRPQASEAALHDGDRALLARIDEGNTWLRAALCTLARRGTLLRQAEPQRAAALMESLSRWPWFKGGQFLFDLMEWEDFMVDGPPPPLIASVLGSASVRRIAAAVAGARALLDDEAARAFDDARRAFDGLTADVGTADAELPDLEPGLYLYRDVVLGVVVSVGPLVAEAARAGENDAE